MGFMRYKIKYCYKRDIVCPSDCVKGRIMFPWQNVFNGQGSFMMMVQFDMGGSLKTCLRMWPLMCL